ncbi:hypothetical protein ABC733_22910 [Mangrovibacter sp. SLW1]
MVEVNEQAANIMDYLHNQLEPVKPLSGDDVQGFMRDSEMRQAFVRMDRVSQEKMLMAMHNGKHPDLADALLRAHPICSGLTAEQLKRLAFSRISTDNTEVISSVAELIAAVIKDISQITAVRTWYANLVFGTHDDPNLVLPRMTSLTKLDEYVGSMMKISQRQGKQPSETQAA